MYIAEIPNMKTDNLTKFIIRCLLVLCLGGVGQVHAYLCNISLEANPPFPETIASTQVVGTVIYQGNLTWRFSGCISLASSGSITLAAGGPQPTSVWGVSGLTVEGGNPRASNYVNTGPFTFTLNGNAYYGGGQTPVNKDSQASWGLLSSFEVTQPITIKASATTVSGNFPDPSRGIVLQDRSAMLAYYKERCMVGPWLIPHAFSICSHSGWGVASNANQNLVGEPQIDLTPAVPRIVSGSAASEQNCKPVLRSSITIPNLKKP